MQFNSEIKSILLKFCSLRYKQKNKLKNISNAKVIYVPEFNVLSQKLNSLKPLLFPQTFIYKSEKDKLVASNCLISWYEFLIFIKKASNLQKKNKKLTTN